MKRKRTVIKTIAFLTFAAMLLTAGTSGEEQFLVLR